MVVQILLNKTSSRKAFSLVETTISLLITSILAAAASYWFFVGNQERYFIRTSSRIQNIQEDTYSQIAKIINEAVRVNGFTMNTYPGIRDSESANINQENLKIFRIRYPEITAGIESVSVGVNKKVRFKLSHVVTPASGDEVGARNREAEEILSGYLAGAVLAPRYAAFYKGNVVNILPVTLVDPSSPERQDNIVLGWFEADLNALPASVTSDTNKISAEIDSSAVVAMVEEMEFRFQARGELAMIEKFPDPTVEKSTLIQTGVDQLVYRFFFSDHQRPQEASVLNLILPDHDLDRWNASDYQEVGCSPAGNPSHCCDPESSSQLCVDIADLATVRINLSMSADFSAKLPRSIVGDRVRVVQNRLYRDAMFSISPAGYGLKLSSEGAAIQDTECLDPNKRCTAACAPFYTDSNPRSPRWRGYGQYKGNPSGTVSNYCECGTGSDSNSDGNWAEHFIPPDTPAGKAAVPWYVPPFENSNNRQINACISYFGDIYEWAWRHPMMWFWWNGLHTAQYRGGSFPNFEWNFEAFDQFRLNFLAHPDVSDSAAVWDDDLQCRLAFGDISRSFLDIWFRRTGSSTFGDISKVTQPAGAQFSNFGTDHAKEGSTLLIMPIEQKCACATEGHVMTKYVCNHKAAPSSPRCSSTWVTEPDPMSVGATRGKYAQGASADSMIEGLKRKVYRVKSGGGFETGLQSVNQAAMCQCLNETYNQPYRVSITDIPTSEGWGVSNMWDFRVDAGDINYTESITSLNGTALTSISGSLPLLTVPGFPNREQVWGSHAMRSQNSINIRKVQVSYQTSESQEPQLSAPINCYDAYRGYLGRCVSPMADSAEKTTILANLAIATPSLGAEQREAYAGYCSKACYNEQTLGAGVGGFYTETGIRAIRQALTSSPDPNQIPIWCGGRISGGFGVF